MQVFMIQGNKSEGLREWDAWGWSKALTWPAGQRPVFIDCRFEQTVMVQLFLLFILPQPSIEAPLFVFRALYSFAFLALCISVSSTFHFLCSVPNWEVLRLADSGANSDLIVAGIQTLPELDTLQTVTWSPFFLNDLYARYPLRYTPPTTDIILIRLP